MEKRNMLLLFLYDTNAARVSVSQQMLRRYPILNAKWIFVKNKCLKYDKDL